MTNAYPHHTGNSSGVLELCHRLDKRRVLWYAIFTTNPRFDAVEARLSTHRVRPVNPGRHLPGAGLCCFRTLTKFVCFWKNIWPAVEVFAG